MIKISIEPWLGAVQSNLTCKTVFLYYGYKENLYCQRIISPSGLKEMPNGEVAYWQL